MPLGPVLPFSPVTDQPLPPMPAPEPDASALEFLIGRDARGNWLAVETRGRAGGFFASAGEAMRYVNGDYHARAKRIELVDTILDPFERTCTEIVRRQRRAVGRDRADAP